MLTSNASDIFLHFSNFVKIVIALSTISGYFFFFSWMLSVSLAFADLVRYRLNYARKNKEKKDSEQEKLKNSMKKLRDTFEFRSQNLKAVIAEKEKRLKNELVQHLTSAEARERMSDLDNDLNNYGIDNYGVEPLPKAEHFRDIKLHLSMFTQKRIRQEILYWNQKDAFIENPTTHFKELHHELTRFTMFINSVNDACYDAFSVFEKQARVMENVLAIESLLGPSKSKSEDKESALQGNLEKIFFGATAIIWIPLLVVGGTLSLPFAAGISIAEYMNSQSNLENYNKKRSVLAKRYLKNFLTKELKEEVLDIFLYEVLCHSDAIRLKLKNYIGMYSQSIEAQINALLNDQRTLQETQNLFNPVLANVKLVLNHLYHFHGRELRVFEFQREKFNNFEDDLIAQGAFSAIYKAFYKSMEKDFAVKMMKETFSEDNALEIFTEEKAWR